MVGDLPDQSWFERPGGGAGEGDVLSIKLIAGSVEKIEGEFSAQVFGEGMSGREASVVGGGRAEILVALLQGETGTEVDSEIPVRYCL